MTIIEYGWIGMMEREFNQIDMNGRKYVRIYSNQRVYYLLIVRNRGAAGVV